MKSIIVVTGGVGFIGSNLIKLLLKKQIRKLLVLIITNMAQKNQINNNRIKYIKSDTKT